MLSENILDQKDIIKNKENKLEIYRVQPKSIKLANVNISFKGWLGFDKINLWKKNRILKCAKLALERLLDYLYVIENSDISIEVFFRGDNNFRIELTKDQGVFFVKDNGDYKFNGYEITVRGYGKIKKRGGCSTISSNLPKDVQNSIQFHMEYRIKEAIRKPNPEKFCRLALRELKGRNK